MNSCRQQESTFFQELYARVQHNGALLYAGRLLQRAARLYPQVIALIHKDEELSYEHLFAQTCVITAILQAQGIQARDRIVICIENSIHFYRAYFGAWQQGAVVVPLNIFLHPSELKHIIEECEPTAIFCDETKREEFAAIIAELQRSILLYSVQDIETLSSQYTAPPTLDPVDLDTHEMAVLLYTSGTTGIPKGVMLSSYNIMMNIMQGMSRLQYAQQERIFAVLPLFHSFAQLGSVWGAFFMGCTVIVVPRIERRFIIDALVHKPTFVLGVPALYGLFCLLKTLDFSSVKYFICGGDMLPDRVRMAFALIYQRKICNGYGLTEMSPLIAVDFDDAVTAVGTVGLSCVRIDCQVRDNNNAVLRTSGPNNAGILWVQGPNLMIGYYKALEMTKAVMQDGWLNTGDLAYLDTDGKIVICGREKDLIIHKGLKIYPAEIENIILQHANVMAVGIIGVIGSGTDEVPIAFVQLRVHDVDAAQELKELCARFLAPYKIPRHFVCTIERIETTATGKIDKKALRARVNDLMQDSSFKEFIENTF